MEHITQEIERIEKKQRFAAPLQENDLDDLVKGGMCQNTEIETKWALRNFYMVKTAPFTICE